MSLATDFILKYRDRRQEELVNATELLATQINARRRMKSAENAALIAAGKPIKHRNVEPNINDIMETHKLFVVRRYMPFVNMAYQYIKKGFETGIGSLVNSEQIIRFSLQGNQGHFIHDMYVHVVLEDTGADNNEDIKYQYCDYPGVRIFKDVVFNTREGYKLDSYSADNVILQTQNFRVTEDNRRAWDYMVGQEDIKEAQYYHPDYNMKQSFWFRNGAQTPRPSQNALELWIPLQFWFNQDFGQAFPIAAIDSDQTNIEIKLERLRNILQATDREGNVIPLPISKLNIKKCDLYTNNIFMDDVVFDPLFSRGIRQLIRVNREQRKILTNKSGLVQLKNMEFSLQEMYFGFRPQDNLQQFNRWYVFSKFAQEDAPVPVIIQTPGLPAQQLVIRTAEIFNLIPPTDSVSFHIQGKIMIYDSYSNTFFNQVTPFKFKKITSPKDRGAFMVAWNVDPTEYNPNGHISLRNNHELNLQYTSSVINSTCPTELVVVGRSINFLVIRNKEATLEQIS